MIKKILVLLSILFFGILLITSFFFTEISLFRLLRSFTVVPLLFCLLNLLAPKTSYKASYIVAFTLGALIAAIPIDDSITVNTLYKILSISAGCAIAFILRFLFEKCKKYKE